MPVKFEFSKRVAKGLKNRVKKEIINAVEGSPAMRKEIARVFQMANRRIQNIENAKLLSPAVTSLDKGDKQGYSKFSVKGYSWEELKREYGRCISFLNQPTSTANGAREFENQLRDNLGCDKELWERVKGSLVHDYNSVIDRLIARIPYAELMQEMYSRAESISRSEMEQEAILAAENLQEQINSQAENVAQSIEDIFNGFEM